MSVQSGKGDPHDVTNDIIIEVSDQLFRLHPADEPAALRRLASTLNDWADKAQARNERDGVPER